MKRYTQTSGALVESFNTFDGAPIGEWVRYEDIKHMLEPQAVPVMERLRMALDSEEFYELSQAYRHSQEWWPSKCGENPVIAAWEKLKQYVLDNADPACTAAESDEGRKDG